LISLKVSPFDIFNMNHPFPQQPDEHPVSCNPRQPWQGSLPSLGLLLAAFSCMPAFAQPAPAPGFNANHRLILPPTSSTVVIDGIGPQVAGRGDAAWTTDGVKFSMEDGAPAPAATMRVLSDANNAYFYFETEDGTFNAQDAVILAINPNGVAGNGHRFIIYPCDLIPGPSGPRVCPGTVVGTPSEEGLPAKISYATGSGSSWTTGPVPSGVAVRSAVAPAGSSSRWSVELKVPRAALGGLPGGLPAIAWFGLFANIIASNLREETAVQYSWPPNQFIGSRIDESDVFGDINSSLLPEGVWGIATLSTAFGRGVSVSSVEFGTGGADPNRIALTQPNTFHAVAINNSVAGSTLTSANDVSATFSISQTGLGSVWTPIPPGTPNPSVGPINLPPASGTRFERLWDLTPAQIPVYRANQFQCVKVTLSSTNPATIFTQPTAQRNMQFVEINSPFERDATLSTRGLGKLFDGQKPRISIREQFWNLDEKFGWKTRIDGAEQIGERLWLANVDPRRDSSVRVSVLADERLKFRGKDFAIAPGTRSLRQAVGIDVKPGSIVTLIADGSIDLGGIEVSAEGITKEALRAAAANRGDSKKNFDLKYNQVASLQKVPLKNLLNRGPTTNRLADRYGALIGSFDNFRTAFFVNSGSSVLVPSNGRTLSLAINDSNAGFESQRGKGFNVTAIATPITPEIVARYPDLRLFETKRKRELILPLGINLPTWVGRGQYLTSRYIISNGKRFQVALPAGSFGYWVREAN
jgi:hypothetical protein